MTDDTDAWLAQQVADTAREMSDRGLSPQKSGNVSARSGDRILITPSGMAYADLLPDDIATLTMTGQQVAGPSRASTETPLHIAIYQAHPEAQAIVHCHSMAATALACAERDIPAFHYMVAVAGGATIPCAQYATFGSNELASNTVRALKDRRACLMAHHGQIAFAGSLRAALDLAAEVETLARQYLDVLSLGEPNILDDEEMQRVAEKFKAYGRSATSNLPSN
jgi:L-fuculose-phosphate aldolase